jgi:hypothetical protein
MDLAGPEGEVADQQVAGELAEACWRQSDAPWRG